MNDGIAPFFEPGLEDLLAEGRKTGRLAATTSLSEALATSRIALLCVGTPSEKNGNLGLDQLRRVTAEITAHVPSRQGEPLIVAVRSTVFPGTCDEVLGTALAGLPGVSIVSNPEFLREGTAVKDFLEPSIVVVGGHDSAAVAEVASLYDGLPGEICQVSLRTAEMIKYACNAFHALKICFANEIGTLSAALNVSPKEVMDTVCRDTHLNVSATYLKPGFAFGGSCLPKDIRSFLALAASRDVPAPFLRQVLPGNQAIIDRAFEMVAAHGRQPVALFGLAFKPGTDDLRESPFVLLAEKLLGRGWELRIHDRHVQTARLTGANRAYIDREIPHLERLLAPTPQAALEGAGLVIVGHVGAEDRPALRAALAGKRVIDLAGMPDLAEIPGVAYQGFCW